MTLRERSENFFRVFSKFLYREFAPVAVHAVALFTILEDESLGNTPEALQLKCWALITSALVGSTFVGFWVWYKVKHE